MEEEKKQTKATEGQPSPSKEFKLYYASYSQQIPSEIAALLSHNEYERFALLQNHNFNIIKTKERPQIYLNIFRTEEKPIDIVFKIIEINLPAFENFLAENEKEPILLKDLKEKTTGQDFKVSFDSKDFLCKLNLFSVGDFEGSSLISLGFEQSDTHKVGDLFEESDEEERKKFFRGFFEYFSNVLDPEASKHYLINILFSTQNQEKSYQLIEDILKGCNSPQKQKEQKEEKLLFLLKIKEFCGERMLEIPKFNKEKGVFETEEKIKIVV